MAAGDFLEVYKAYEYERHFDCVVTCFFIDCAHNIMEFIDIIHKILKPGKMTQSGVQKHGPLNCILIF